MLLLSSAPSVSRSWFLVLRCVPGPGVTAKVSRLVEVGDAGKLEQLGQGPGSLQGAGGNEGAHVRPGHAPTARGREGGHVLVVVDAGMRVS